MSKMLAYGTLREGDYNFDRVASAFGSDSIRKIGETKVKGFSMHNLGYFPAIVPSDDTDEILCDILEVDDKAFNFIDAMERGAGYAVTNVALAADAVYPIYTHTRDLSQYPKVTSGNWFEK